MADDSVPGTKVLQVPSSCEVEWTVAATNLPAEAWVWRRVPGSFDASVVSNLLDLGPFNRANATNNLGEGPFPDPSMVFYHNTETRRQLGLFPPWGWFYFHDDKVSGIPKDYTSQAPDTPEALSLALRWLEKIRIPTNELARLPESGKLRVVPVTTTTSRFHKETGKIVKQVHVRSIFFTRHLDGLDFAGIGRDAGFTIGFAYDWSVVEMQLVWPKLERWRKLPVCSAPQFEEQIRRGEAKIAKLQSMTVEKLLPRAKTLRIVSLTPLYLGSDGEEPPDFVRPFLAIESRLSDGTEEQTLHFNCRLLVEPSAP